MPELFGSTYVLPAIIVVVLLLVLVLALLLNKRSRERKAVGTMDARGTAPQKGGGGQSRAAAERRPVPAAAGSRSAEDEVVSDSGLGPDAGQQPVSAAVAEMDEPPKESHAVARPRPRKDWGDVGPASQVTASGDPLKPVLVSLLRGWGELTREDLNRLSVFRPERVQTAVRALELPKDLKNDQDARARLDQLARYAGELDVADHDPASPAESLVEPPAETVAETSTETVPETSAEMSGEMLESTESVAAMDSLEGDPATETVGAAAEDEIDSGGPGESQAAITPTADVSEVTPPEDDAEDTSIAVAPTPWLQHEIDPRTEWSAETLTRAPMEEPSDDPFASTTGAMEREPADLLDDTLETPPRRPSRLADQVKTSQDLLALPPEEQAEMVAFLQPAELADVLRHTENSQLKRAVIDTLEHVSTPASLEVLRQCLDDRDPEIQMYALQAADRILGAD